MKKAITLVALAGVAMTTEFEDNELNIFKKIGGGLKKAGQFVIKHPKILTTAAALLLDDQELFSLKDLQDKDLQERIIQSVTDDIHKVKEYAAAHPELIERVKAEIKKYKHDHSALKTDIKHAMDKLAQHPEILAGAAEALKKFHAAHKFQIEAEDHELFNKDLFNKITDDIKKGIKYAHEHPEVVQDGKNIINDIKTHDKKQLIHDSIKTLLDLGFEDQDIDVLSEEELFKIGNVVKKIAGGVKKGVKFVGAHPELIKDGVNIVKDIKGKKYGQLIKDGIKTYKDIRADDEEFFAFEDEELFSLKDKIHKGVDFVKKHPAIIKDGVNIVKDIKGHKYGNLIKDGIKTYKDLGFEDVEFFAFDDDELFQVREVHAFKDLGFEDQTDNSLFNLGDLLKDGKKIKEDVKNRDVKELIKDGVKIVKDVKEVKKFLF